MPRKGRKRSAAQMRQTKSMRKMRWASPEEAKEISEAYQRTAAEAFKVEMAKAEREAEESRRALRESEIRVR